MDYDPLPYELVPALLHWLRVLGLSLAIVVLVSLATSLAVLGKSGPKLVLRQILSGLRDLVNIAPRRVWAIALLTIREAIRRKALLVFVLFAVLFMFGGWFLTDSNARPELQVKVHVSFVLTAIAWLILPVVLLLSCWGIPEDIRARSMHTVVTKPVRRIEIVLGRIVGFAGVGTLVLAVMCTVGYVWINRQLPQEVRQSQLVCRVPVYGTLSFLNREGNVDSGINVGDVWKFREYIEGATKAAAIWEINGVNESMLVPVKDPQTGEMTQGLLFETRFESFRSHKGVIGRGLLAQMRFVNDEKKLRVPVPAFEVLEYRGNLEGVPRKISYRDEEAREMRTVDLIDDLAAGGKLRVEVQCLNSGQYLGMARPDLFIRTPDRHFAHGYFKASAGIWMMMVLVVMLGVTASCFVKGPVATLLTFAVLVIGQGLRELMGNIVTGQQRGGGPLESIVRMVKHLNQTVPLDDAWWVPVMESIDRVSIECLWLVQQIIPNFDYYKMSPYVANGFDVNWNAAMMPSIVITAAYLIPCLLLGYYSLKLRELESK